MLDQSQQDRAHTGKRWVWDDCRSAIQTHNLYTKAEDAEDSKIQKIKQDDTNDADKVVFSFDPSIALTNPLKNGVKLK